MAAMSDQDRTNAQLIAENEALRQRVAALEASERRYRTIIDTVPLAIGEVDRDGIFVFTSAATEKVLGYCPEEIVGTTAWDRIGEGPAQEAFRAWYGQTMATQPTPSPAFGFRVKKNGARIDIRADWNYLRNEKGQVTGLVTVLADITERKRAEEALRESERRFRSLFRDSVIGMVVVTPRGEFLQANRAFCEFLGYSEDELTGQTVLSITHPDDQQVTGELMRQALASAPRILHIEKRYLHKSGQVLWGDVSSILAHDAAGKPSYFITQVLDIGGRKRAEASLKKAHEELEQRVEDRTAELSKANGQLTREVEERRRAEEALRDSEGRLTFALEVNHTGAWDLDLVDHKIQRSLQHDQIFGYESHLPTWTYEMFLDRVVPEDRADVDRQFRQAVESRGDWRFDCRIRRNDGQIRWIFAAGRLRPGNERNAQRMTGIVQDITDRKQAEEALRESEEKYRTLVETSPDAVMLLDLKGRITLASQRAVQLYGAERVEEVLGRNSLDFLAPEHQQTFATDLQRTIEEGMARNVEYTLLRKDGSRFSGEGAAAVIRDASGKPTALVAVVRDITARKQAEEALRASEERFRSYFEQGLIGMAVSSVEMRWIQVNDHLCDMLGYSREELVGMKWTEITHPDDLQRNLVPQNRLLAGEIDHFTLSKRFVRKDKAVVHARVFVRCFRHPDGTTDHILALIEDVTERTLVQEALRQSEERYRTVLEDQTEVICRFKIDGSFTFVNEVFCRFFGKTNQELVGAAWQPFVFSEDVPTVVRRLRALSPSDPIAVIEKRVHSALGRVHWMQVVNRGFFDQAGRLTEIQAVGRDITERKQAQEALERERRSLWRMLQASDHERQTISYEIHDGLAQYLAAATMQFQTHDALREKSPDKARKAYETAVELVCQSHAEARRLVSEVRPPIIDEIGLETAITHLVHEQRRRGGPEIEFHSSVQFGRLPVILENALYRIAQEALTNACKYSQSNKVAVTMTQQGQDVRLEVRDWGVGFDSKSVDKDHFGLEGIRQRVRLLGGQATIESAPGSGTLVQVVVPIVERQSGE
jgi:PAS domain S-box-containing protein